jgi:hypothetical protein
MVHPIVRTIGNAVTGLVGLAALVATVSGCPKYGVRHYYRPGTPQARAMDSSNLATILSDVCDDYSVNTDGLMPGFTCKQSYCPRMEIRTTYGATGTPSMSAYCPYTAHRTIDVIFSTIQHIEVEGARVTILTPFGEQEIIAKDRIPAVDLGDAIYGLTR